MEEFSTKNYFIHYTAEDGTKTTYSLPVVVYIACVFETAALYIIKHFRKSGI